MSPFWTLVEGELRLQLRQPLAVALIILVPLLLVPGGLVGSEVYLLSLERASLGDGTASGERPMLVVAADPELAQWLEPEDRLVVTSAARVPSAGPAADGDAHAQVEVDGHTLKVTYRHDLSSSRGALGRLREVAERASEGQRTEALKAAGVDLPMSQLVVLQTVDDVAPGVRGGDRLGAVLPPLLLFCIVTVAIYTALDVISGEKERGTVETLLVQPLDRRVVVLAKGFLTTGLATFSAWVGLLGLLALSVWSPLDLVHVLDGAPTVSLSLGSAGIIGGTSVLLAAQVTAVALVLAAWAPDYRTGSMFSGPAMLLVMAPSALATSPTVELGPLLGLMPVANVSLACRQLLVGELTWGLGGLVLMATAAHVGIAWLVTSQLLDREQALLPATWTPRRDSAGWLVAVTVWLIALGLLWFFARPAQRLDPVLGMVFTQVALLGALTVVTVLFLGLPVRASLGFRRPRLIDGVLATMAGLSLSVVTAWVAGAQPNPMHGAVQTASAFTVGVAFAVLPAFFEEMLFRGLLLHLLRRWSAWVRVCSVGVAFGAIHWATGQVLPATLAGVVMGVAMLRTRSLWVVVWMHALHNGVYLWVWRNGSILDPPPLVVASSASLLMGSLLWLGRTSPKSSVPEAH